MIENTDAEQIERLNARVVELLRENGRLQEAKRRALLIADERAKEAADLRLQLVKVQEAITAGRYYISQLNSAWMGRSVRDLDEAASAWLKASVDASSLTDDQGTKK